MELFEKVKKIRKDSGLTQKEFGEKLGVSRSVINNIESNVLAKPEQKLPLFKLICKEFDISEEWFFQDKGEMFNKVSIIEKLSKTYNFSEPEKIMLENYTKLTVEERRSFTNYLMKLLGINNITAYASSTDSNLRDDIIDEVDEENSKNDIDKSHNIRNS